MGEDEKRYRRARARMDKAFGIGVDAAHQILRTEAGAKRIYDCALSALMELDVIGSVAPRGYDQPAEMSPVERAARALAENDRGCDDDYRLYLDDVSIVLREIDTATEDMLIAGEEVCYLVSPGEIEKQWSTMVSVLQKECVEVGLREFPRGDV